METNERDPYATPPTPKSKSGPILRFAIVGALLVAGAVGVMNLPRGGELVPVETEDTTLADNSLDTPYVASSADEFVDPSAAPTADGDTQDYETLPPPTTTPGPAIPPG